MLPPLSPDADRRASALSRLGVLDSPPPEGLERVARLAAYVAGGEGSTVSAAVHLLDDRLQHRVAGVGVPLEASPAGDSLCRRVLRRDGAVHRPDATVDPRLAGTPWTSGDAPVRLCASVPLRLLGRADADLYAHEPGR